MDIIIANIATTLVNTQGIKKWSCMVANNLMSLFRHFALNHNNRAMLKTLKVYCFALEAWTVNHAQ
ncbi:MAG: hypothetical protein ABI844_15395 [Saprospiraceae bacterium]